MYNTLYQEFTFYIMNSWLYLKLNTYHKYNVKCWRALKHYHFWRLSGYVKKITDNWIFKNNWSVIRLTGYGFTALLRVAKFDHV